MKRNRKVKDERLKVKGLPGWIVLSIFTFQFSILYTCLINIITLPASFNSSSVR